MTNPGWTIEERELFADLETPVSAYLKLRRRGARFLLESVERGTSLGRFSFIGLHPLVEIECGADGVRVFTPDGRSFQPHLPSGTGTRTGPPIDPTEVLSAFLHCLENQRGGSEVARAPGDLVGGAVGYLSFEYIQFIERVAVHSMDSTATPLARFLIPRTWISFDHLRRRMHLRSMQPTPLHPGPSPGGCSELELQRFAQSVLKHAAESLPRQQFGAAEIDDLVEALHQPRIDLPPPEHGPPFQPEPDPAPEVFENSVRHAKEHIRQGDIFQVVLSQRLRGGLRVHPFQVYRALRMLNPSPYLFYVDFAPTRLIGSSPELLVKLDGREATVRPIAGTRRRGKHPAEDKEIERELLHDEKEQAEHVMLVDLGRNDLGRVCEYGSVSVTDFKTVERYSHVMHMVSYVRGTLRSDLDCFDLLRATFPAGTVSGAPKIRAMEIIHDLERFRRGPYAGALGYFGPRGEMDLCITIRTIVCEGSTATLQAGAGVVADSDSHAEHLECLGKMQVLLEAVRIAEEGLR